MAQKKLLRFEAIKSFPNVLQYPENISGKWKDFFKNTNPITIELACGRGEYTVGLAKIFPEKNFIGVDLKGNRIYTGAKKCIDEKILNAAFLRVQIDKINYYFLKNEVKLFLNYLPHQYRREILPIPSEGIAKRYVDSGSFEFYLQDEDRISL